MSEEQKTIIERWYAVYKGRTSKESLSAIDVFFDRFKDTSVDDISADIEYMLATPKSK